MDGQQDDILVRRLRRGDASRLVEIDRAITGRSRSEWYEGKLKRALEESDVCVSLGAELEGRLVGAILGSLHYGEFGLPEPIAVLDTILVEPLSAGKGIGTALLDQLVKNLRAFGIERLRTEVAWDEPALNGFLAHRGFSPAPRLVLELPLSP